ncbi:hypothetical protein B0H12DRAFT_1230788 [Mycena haematopus]|nr:hypothetical protein B0H12DRAFT_1230788 [Mycena haematopus]
MSQQSAPFLLRPGYQQPKPVDGPTWPEELKSFDQLSAYLLHGTPTALGDNWFTVDFYPPKERSERREGDPAYKKSVYDESTYTPDDPTVPYVFMLFGKVCTTLVYRDSHCTFSVEGGDELPDGLKKAFAHQVQQLGQIPIPDNFPPDSPLVPCIGTANGSDVIFIHTGHRGKVSAFVHRYVDGALERTRTSRVHFPVDIGEWALIQATLHRRVDSAGVRMYEILARNIRVLGTTAALLQVSDESEQKAQYTGAEVVVATQSLAAGSHSTELAASASAAEESAVVTTPKKRARNDSPPAVPRRSPRKASAVKSGLHSGGGGSKDASSPSKRGRRGRKSAS